MRRGLVLVVTAMLLVAVPAVLLVWLRIRVDDRLTALDPDPVPVVVPVVEREFNDLQAVAVEGVFGEPTTVVAPSWSGTVTSVTVERGDVVSSGRVVAAIDGVDRTALATSQPFWRFLHRRDTGPDVAMLQEWLHSSGFYEGDIDGVYGRDLESAMRLWAVDIGVVRPDGSFDPGWMVWLPSAPFRIDAVEVDVGSPAPSAGTPVLIGPVPLTAVSVTDQEGREFVEPGSWVLTVGDAVVPMRDGVVDAAEFDALVRVLAPEQPASGRVTLAEPVLLLTVPATSVVSNASGGVCVFVSSAGSFEPVSVELAGGRVGMVDVAKGLVSGDAVLANPADIFATPTCP